HVLLVATRHHAAHAQFPRDVIREGFLRHIVITLDAALMPLGVVPGAARVHAPRLHGVPGSLLAQQSVARDLEHAIDAGLLARFEFLATRDDVRAGCIELVGPHAICADFSATNRSSHACNAVSMMSVLVTSAAPATLSTLRTSSASSRTETNRFVLTFALVLFAMSSPLRKRKGRCRAPCDY